MTDKEQLWTLVQEAMQAFAPFYRDAMQQAIQDSGVPDNWFALSLAQGSDPAPFTVERFHAMSPYTARERSAETLEELARLELLERVGEDAYRLTDLGREAVGSIYGAAHQSLGTVEPLPADEMRQLNNLLYRLVEANLEAPEPENKWAIAYSRRTDPGEDAPGAVQTDQYLTDLVRFRDDAHIAAWKPYGVSGHAWEALTFVWRGEARTAEELAEKLPFRGHSAEVYAEALADLANRGWAEETADGYRVTEQGQTLRQQAEEATNSLFFAPWASLSNAENAQLHDLLTQLKNSLDVIGGITMDLKQKVLNLLKRAYEEEQSFVAKLSDEERAAVGTLEHWSAKDLLAHIVVWQERRMRDIAAGPGIEESSVVSDIDEINAEIFEEERDLSWADLLGRLELIYRSLIEGVEAWSDDDLAAIQAVPRQEGRPLWRLIAGTGYIHPIIHFAQYYTERGEAYYATGLCEEAAASLMQLDDSSAWQGVTRYNLACHYALSSQHERAISELREALQLNPDLTEWSKEDPDFASIREHPAYQSLYKG